MDSIIYLAQLFSVCESISGKKRIQKMVHLLQECGNAPSRFQFSLALYGAFSSDLAQTLETLAEEDILRNEKVHSGDYSTLKYSFNEDVTTELEVDTSESSNLVWAHLARELNGWTTKKLEAVSTVVYLKRAGWSNERLKEQYQASKPHLMDIYEDAIDEANRLLRRSVSR